MASRKHPLTSLVLPDERWTTTDEISTMRSWAERGMLRHLKTALELLPNRRWYGPGMDVDPVAVARALREMIATVEQRQIRQAFSVFSDSERVEEEERVARLMATQFPKQTKCVTKKKKADVEVPPTIH